MNKGYNRNHRKYHDENDSSEERPRLASPTIYEIIATEGKEELSRPFASLAWSAIVAGICISFCLLCEAYFLKHIGDEGGAFFVSNLGYTVGFLFVVLGRFQLFTENTITVILPLLERITPRCFTKTMRLWGIVLCFNFIGTFIVASILAFAPYISPEYTQALTDISKHAVEGDFLRVFLAGIPAGFVIALMVWMMPNAHSYEFFVIFLATYVIAIGDFSHVVAGSAEAFYLLLGGHISFIETGGYILAAGLGNILGGTGLFTFMAYSQVREEI
jgi:formate/nitrite transporter FocA (FNT family)